MSQLFFYKDNGEKQNIDFVTSDQHFGHLNIIPFANRNEDNLQEMHQHMIEQWNSVVRPEHTVLHLGDAALGLHEESLKNYELCNGSKFLIPGNHDPISILKSPNYREKKRHLYEAQFSILHEKPLRMELVMNSKEVVTIYASHYPHDDGSEYQRKYRKLELLPPMNHHLVHGHTHSSEVLTVNENNIISYHAGVDAHNYVPVSVEQLAKVFAP